MLYNFCINSAVNLTSTIYIAILLSVQEVLAHFILIITFMKCAMTSWINLNLIESYFSDTLTTQNYTNYRVIGTPSPPRTLSGK